MGRRSGGRSSFRPSPAAARSPAPQPVHSAPPPAPAQASSGGGGLISTLGSSIADGFGWGTGISIAHRAVEAVMGPRTIKVQYETVESASAPAGSNMVASSCDNHAKAFQDCLSNYGSEISKCQFYSDMLSACRKNSGSMISA